LCGHFDVVDVARSTIEEIHRRDDKKVVIEEREFAGGRTRKAVRDMVKKKERG
jgi:hypothetical protein